MSDNIYNMTSTLAERIHVLKGFEAAYSNPRNGKLIVSYGGHNYLLKLTELKDGELGDVYENHFYEFQ